MSINGGNRSAGGGFTLPQQAFIPHPGTRPLQTGRVEHPAITSGMVSATPDIKAAWNVHGVANMFLGSTHLITGGPR